MRKPGLLLGLAGAALMIAATPSPNPPAYATPEQVFEAMRAAFQPQKADGLHVRYQFQLSGPNGGDWFIEVKDGKCAIGRGTIANADVTFLASAHDWVAISNGKLNGTWAYFLGRLKIHGDQHLARQLDEMFP
jgi:putative sterol carrier protein